MIFIAITLVVLFFTYQFFEDRRKKNELKDLIKKRKAEQVLNFEWCKKNFEKLDEIKAEEITSLKFEDLQNALREGSVKPSDVLRAYQRKAYKANESTNSVCLFITRATELAESLDQTSPNSDYPLYGIPVSIKESIHVKHMDSTMGYAQLLNQPSDEDAAVVEQIIRFGGIPFVHTNVPIALLSFGCCNPVYGATSNPLDITRVPGGSSGGEAALVALGASPLGIGTDVGGSIRTPASFCGVSGFKSSADRTSQLGKVATIPGRQLLQSIDGPIAPTIGVCVEYLKMKWNDRKLLETDIYMAPVPFQTKIYESTQKLRIGYYYNDGYQATTPAFIRAVEKTKKLLEDAGHTLVEFEVPRPHHMFNIFCAGATSDGGLYLLKTLQNDIVPKECDIGFQVAKLPQFVQKLLRLYWPVDRQRGIIQELPHDTEEMREMHEKIEDYRHEFVVAMRKLKLDAIVCPAFGSQPPHHGTPNQMLSATSYTALYNLIDFAAGTVPVTRVTREDEGDLKNMDCNDKWDDLIRSESMGCVGLPVSVQIATPPFKEEMCLRLLKYVEDNIHAI